MQKIIHTGVCLVIAGLLLVQLTGCYGTPDKGIISNGVYSNEFFAFDFPIPEGWYVYNDQQTLRTITNEGINFIAQDNPQAREIMQQAQGSFLMFMSRYSLDQELDKINPNIIFGFENIAQHRGVVRDSEDYLRIAADETEKMSPGYKFENNIVPIQLGSAAFSRIDATLTLQGIPIHQRMMATIKKNHVLLVNLTGGSRSDIEDLTRIVQKTTFR